MVERWSFTSPDIFITICAKIKAHKLSKCPDVIPWGGGG